MSDEPKLTFYNSTGHGQLQNWRIKKGTRVVGAVVNNGKFYAYIDSSEWYLGTHIGAYDTFLDAFAAVKEVLALG